MTKSGQPKANLIELRLALVASHGTSPSPPPSSSPYVPPNHSEAGLSGPQGLRFQAHPDMYGWVEPFG